MKYKFIIFGAISLFLIFASCDNIVDPIIPNDIQNFVDNLNLNKPQKIKLIVEVNSEDVYIFKVPCGEPSDCPSGCFYANFFGLKNKNKISDIEFYDLDSTDSFLFSEEFSELVEMKDEWIYYSQYLPLLAGDEETPLTVLLRIAEILNNYISTYIAYKLLDNPAVQSNVEIITILAHLPSFQGDPYEDVREIANNILGN